jgi:hypothetical protein
VRELSRVAPEKYGEAGDIIRSLFNDGHLAAIQVAIVFGSTNTAFNKTPVFGSEEVS